MFDVLFILTWKDLYVKHIQERILKKKRWSLGEVQLKREYYKKSTIKMFKVLFNLI